ncbi:MAG: pitrilysin family protein [Bacteroidales bacterium]|jgi:predicted Zn-dependent peptidase|nr:insulinase family protein [Bacteroidales bacterium]MDD2630889.1 pitrilysin family protein [Bacteroidales bacterium]MDD3526714.1 pitrilysin family protein [Bacteroidales bacterium]MDD4176589.1 pitrilysin family protein [Bacteroidales bacterium]MDD4740269.1 pitrilysin family protein [Bacteroidales bacterium]
MDYQYSQLPNGIRIIHKQVPANVAHLGVIIDAGTRDELPDQSGLAHLIEHMIFKGTHRRKAFHILSRLENVGGELNAYTSKEETCVYASFLHAHYPRALELFADIITQSTYPDKELEKEKDVVIDEINSYKDNPSELIFDDFETLLFRDHPMGRNILGTPETVRKLRRTDIMEFLHRNYQPQHMVISSVGNISMNRLLVLINKNFGFLTGNENRATRLSVGAYQPTIRTEALSNFQAHCIIGAPAYDVFDKKKAALALLINILGGPGMNSRLNLKIREKYGYCYNIEAHYHPYSDGGYFNIYLGTDMEYLEKTVKLALKELNLLRTTRLGALQLHRAKLQIAGQLAIALESNAGEMISMGKSHLYFEKVDSYRQVMEKINALTDVRLLEVANEIFDTSQLSRLNFVPQNT